MLQAVKNKVPKTFTTLTRYKLQEIQLLELVQVAQQDIMAYTANKKHQIIISPFKILMKTFKFFGRHNRFWFHLKLIEYKLANIPIFL